MTKVTVQIEDVADKKSCVVAIQQLYAKLEEHYGEKAAGRIWDSYHEASPKYQARRKLEGALSGLEYSDQRLIFEYYAMAMPSKEGLAKDLAAKNVLLHEKWREWLTADRQWQVQHGEEFRRQREIIELARG